MHVQKQTPCTHIHRNEFAMYYTSLSLKLAEFKAQGILQPFIAKKSRLSTLENHDLNYDLDHAFINYNIA